MGSEGHGHIPVMLDEALEYLALQSAGVIVDCTAGAGGHAEAIASKLSPEGRLVALDRDASAVERVKTRLERFPNATVLQRNYAEIGQVLDEIGVEDVDGILIDAGLSSVQLDDPQRGFSFQADGPLDMRMDRANGVPASAWLAQTPETELARALKDYGDVGPAKRIAAAIKRGCEAGDMNTTVELRDAVKAALDFVKGEPDEIRTVFQAVRMAVNEELAGLETAIRDGASRLNPGGRIVVISFHSGEDRVVKNVIRELSRARKELYPDGRVRRTVAPLLKVLTASPVLPTAEEQARNPRAKSAKLRAAERLGEKA